MQSNGMKDKKHKPVMRVPCHYAIIDRLLHMAEEYYLIQQGISVLDHKQFCHAEYLLQYCTLHFCAQRHDIPRQLYSINVLIVHPEIMAYSSIRGLSLRIFTCACKNCNMKKVPL